jgi:TonB family protein
MGRKHHHLLRFLPAVIAIVLIVIIGVVVYHFRSFFEKPVQAKKQIQQVSIIQPPPPPPPPPEQPPPPPPEIKEEKIEEPEPEPEPEEQAEEPPPGEDLGVDAEGGVGSDGFGLVGKKGGQGFLGGGSGNSIIWYGQQAGRELQNELQALINGTPARGTAFSVTINIWIGPDGRLTRAELADGSGKRDVDEALRSAVSRLHITLPKPPPDNMPQPVKVRVTSRT